MIINRHSADVIRFVKEAEEIAGSGKADRLVILRFQDDYGDRIPLTIADSPGVKPKKTFHRWESCYIINGWPARAPASGEEMRRIRRKHNYLFSIIRTMLLSGIIPLLILGALSYKGSSNALKKKVSETNILLLEQTRMRFEQALDIIYNYYVILGNDPNITDQLNRNLTYSDVTVIPEIQKKLHELQNLQDLVSASKLVNLQNDWVIYHDYFQDHVDGNLRSYMENRMAELSHVFWTFEEERDNQISLFIKLPYNSGSTTSAIIVDLNQKEIHKYFIDDSDKKMLVVDDGGYIVHFHDGGMIGSRSEAVLGPGYGKKLAGDQGAFAIRDGSGESQYVIYEKSGYNGWTYFILYDVCALNRDIISIRRLTFLMIGILVFALSLISVFWSSKRLYSPVGNIYDSVKEKLLLDKESGAVDEFSYIGRGVDNLYNEKLMLQVEMARQSIQIEELFLRKLIRGELSLRRVEERTRSIGKFCDYSGYYIVCFRMAEVRAQREAGKDEELTAIMLLSAVRACLEEGRYLTPVLKNGVVVALFDSSEKDELIFREKLFVELVRLQTDIGRQIEEEIAVGISNIQRDPLNAEIAFKESIEALMCNWGQGKKTPIRFFEDMAPGKVIHIVYPKGQEEELIQWINNSNSEKSVQTMKGIIDHIFGTPMGYSEHMLYVSRLLIKLTNILQDSGISLQELFEKSENPMDQVINLTNTEDIKSWFRHRLIEPIIPLLKKQRSSRNKSLICDIRQIISENYDQDISLEECAYRLDYHPSYIWRVMKQEMGIGFTEYLLAYRMQQARKLLIETNESIGAIAEKLCYNNTQNFIRYFKKREGVTPGAFRKEHQN